MALRHTGWVRRPALVGCPEPLASLSSSSASGIALDAQFVYWGGATLDASMKRAQ